MISTKRTSLLATLCVLFLTGFAQLKTTENDIKSEGLWPSLKKEMHPWTRWWWLGSAVDEKNLDRVLTEYKNAGFGGVEVTPIYGAVGFEKRYVDFLSPEWMSMLQFTVNKANSLNMGVDMNTGTGWPFGGSQIKFESAASKLIAQKYTLSGGETLNEKIILNDAKQLEAGSVLQAVTAYSDDGQTLLLTDKVDKDGRLNWSPTTGKWNIIAAFSGKTLQVVKRAAPGGEGLVLNHFSKKPVDIYLSRFDNAFAGKIPGIRAFFNDSYEVYNASWSPDLLDEFKRRRGYDLSLYLKQLTSNDTTETTARVKSDYRETMSDMLLNNFTLNWTNWAHGYKKITKNQAHGSPGNLLDLYGTVDIPECEAFFGTSYFPIPGLRRDTSDIVNPHPNPVIFKFASSAAHNLGKPLTSSETFVWLTEHFKTSLSQCKPEVEQLWLGGINHVFYHGTTYSPEDVPFPGWLFYASSNFVPSNSLWPHLSGLNDYIARCQSVLQAGKSDNELLLYWPVYDAWSNTNGLDMQLSMHNLDEWLTPTAFSKIATDLQQVGYSMDFISDKMLAQTHASNGVIQTNPLASPHKVLMVPACNYMPVETLQKIIQLAKEGATVIMQELPLSPSGMNNIDKRKTTFKSLLSTLSFNDVADGIKQFKTGNGKVILANNVQNALEFIKQSPEELTYNGIKFIRRSLNDGKYYYLVNHTAKTINQYIPLSAKAASVAILDPQSTAYGLGATRITNGKTNVRVQMQPGEALILRTFATVKQPLKAWKYVDGTGEPLTLSNEWNLHFTNGGPELPADQKLTSLISWTELKDKKAIAFSGSGEYTTTFNLPAKLSNEYLLKLGQVNESAHVWINGKDVGILWSFPFEARVGKYVKPGANTIKIEVANLMANRIRDMDKKGIQWRNYHEINFVNIKYKPFDASKWEPQVSGLLGPVSITAVE